MFLNKTLFIQTSQVLKTCEVYYLDSYSAKRILMNIPLNLPSKGDFKTPIL